MKLRVALAAALVGCSLACAACSDPGPASQTAPEPNIGPAALPGGGPAEAPAKKSK
jgi:hypothetical protein